MSEYPNFYRDGVSFTVVARLGVDGRIVIERVEDFHGEPHREAVAAAATAIEKVSEVFVLVPKPSEPRSVRFAFHYSDLDQPAQSTAESRPPSGEAPASETPAAPAPHS